jgi:hypothetical protein
MSKIETLIRENKKLWIEGFLLGTIAIMELGILIFKQQANNFMIAACVLIFFGLGLSSWVAFATIIMNKKTILRTKEFEEKFK